MAGVYKLKILQVKHLDKGNDPFQYLLDLVLKNGVNGCVTFIEQPRLMSIERNMAVRGHKWVDTIVRVNTNACLQELITTGSSNVYFNIGIGKKLLNVA